MGIPVRLIRILSAGQPRSTSRSRNECDRARTSGNVGEQFAQFFDITGTVRPRLHVHPVKRNNRRARPTLDKRQKVYARVSEVNVHQIRCAAPKIFFEHPILAAVDDRRLAPDVFEPKTPNEIARWLARQFDIVERELFFALTLLGNDKRAVALKACHLPVDVQHLRFQESGAIAGDGAFDNRDQVEIGLFRAMAYEFSQARLHPLHSVTRQC